MTTSEMIYTALGVDVNKLREIELDVAKKLDAKNVKELKEKGLTKRDYQKHIDEAVDLIGVDYKINADNNEVDMLMLVEELLHHFKCLEEEKEDIIKERDDAYEQISLEKMYS